MRSQDGRFTVTVELAETRNARVVWADLGYGIAVGVLGPIALFRAFARM